MAGKICGVLFGDMKRTGFLLPYDKGGIVSYLCENGQIDSMEYAEQGTVLKGRFKAEDVQRYAAFET